MPLRALNVSAAQAGYDPPVRLTPLGLVGRRRRRMGSDAERRTCCLNQLLHRGRSLPALIWGMSRTRNSALGENPLVFGPTHAEFRGKPHPASTDVGDTRNATTGSTRAARRAGTQLTSRHTDTRNTDTPTKTPGSSGLVSNRIARSCRVSASAAPTPSATPTSARPPASASTSRRTSPTCARRPSGWRSRGAAA